MAGSGAQSSNTTIAASRAWRKYLQKRGIKPNRHARYRKYVAAMRGWLESEVGRCLNRLVAVRAPAELVVERLDFRAPGLRRRLNRLLSNMGKGAIEAKLKDLEERFGIVCRKVVAAYSSQADSARGYADRKNRAAQAAFRCLWCGHRQRADVNAARYLIQRRSLGDTGTGRASRVHSWASWYASTSSDSTDLGVGLPTRDCPTRISGPGQPR